MVTAVALRRGLGLHGARRRRAHPAADAGHDLPDCGGVVLLAILAALRGLARRPSEAGPARPALARDRRHRPPGEVSRLRLDGAELFPADANERAADRSGDDGALPDRRGGLCGEQAGILTECAMLGPDPSIS
ncbi:hypothetical protein BOSEA31B_10107 [Hyphomicrobiales bacterium]|nr:hypothetical protein BOSEA31B_10107 [Hyphomicrobiales bacterium]CAH1701787.1 hypothetical protein BOSEA1005_21486 [Hyphomicrobiales bacterium]